jgi:hypothetical protein
MKNPLEVGTTSACPCPLIRACTEAFDRYAARACRVGVRLDQGCYRVYAPSGFEDLFGSWCVRIPVVAPRHVYETKAAPWQRLWLRLEVLPWPAPR